MAYQLSSSSDWHESGDDVYYKPLTGGNYTGINWDEDTIAAIEVANTNSYVATLSETQDYNVYLNIAEKPFAANAGADVITCVAHGILDGETVRFKGGDLPEGLVQSTVYYVRDRTTDTFKVAATAGGTVINITDPGSGVMTLNAPSLRSSGDQKIRVVSATATPTLTGEAEESLVDAIFAGGNVDGYNLEQSMRLALAALVGKVTASETSFVARAADDSKIRISATVTADGDRTAVALNAD